jgi:hypothetical protein
MTILVTISFLGKSLFLDVTYESVLNACVQKDIAEFRTCNLCLVDSGFESAAGDRVSSLRCDVVVLNLTIRWQYCIP